MPARSWRAVVVVVCCGRCLSCCRLLVWVLLGVCCGRAVSLCRCRRCRCAVLFCRGVRRCSGLSRVLLRRGGCGGCGRLGVGSGRVRLSVRGLVGGRCRRVCRCGVCGSAVGRAVGWCVCLLCVGRVLCLCRWCRGRLGCRGGGLRCRGVLLGLVAESASRAGEFAPPSVWCKSSDDLRGGIGGTRCHLSVALRKKQGWKWKAIADVLTTLHS